MFPQCSLQTNSAVESSLAARSSMCTTPSVITSRVKTERNGLRDSRKKDFRARRENVWGQKGVHGLVTITIHPRLKW